MLCFVISKEYVHVTIREPLSPNPNAIEEIYLAPFGRRELKDQIPFKPEYTEFDPFPDGVDPTSPQGVLSWFDDDKHGLTWGIYTDEPSANTLVGATGITESETLTADGSTFSKDTQEVHIGLFSKEHFGKSIGTAAVLAVMKYAIERHDTQSFYAYTSEHNDAIHRMMRRTGFVMLERKQYIAFPGGENTEYWMTHGPGAQVELPPNQQPVFNKAWQRLDKCMRKLNIVTAP